MKQPLTYLREYIDGKILTWHMQHDGSAYFDETLKEFNHKPLLEKEEASRLIREGILSAKPFMVSRFGAVELATMKTFDFEISRNYKIQLERIHIHAGVFPEEESVGKRFTEMMIQNIPYADLMGIWPQAFEEYYLRTYGSKDCQYTLLSNLNPWIDKDNPWTAALAGKKVLVIHPFEDSIRAQYKRREELFPGTDILPEFELDVMKSIQTAAGGEDERFSTWFEACDYMCQEVRKRDFDTAILGCGAYGFPLAAEIKKSGRQAIHLGGATQLLFGILGERWVKNPDIMKMVNDSWVRPLESEKPKDAKKVENNCYW